MTKLRNKKPSCSYMTSRTKQLTGSDFKFCVTTSFIRALITFLDPDGDYILVPQALLWGLQKKRGKRWRFWECFGPVFAKCNLESSPSLSTWSTEIKWEVITIIEILKYISAMEKCYENLLKYFVFLCNLIFALAGACLVGFGAYVQVWS